LLEQRFGHGSTGRRPAEVFEQEERAALLPLPVQRHELVLWKKARVHRDAHVALGRRLYSVPWRLIGQEVWLRITPSTVTVHGGPDEARVATHRRVGPPRSTDPGHLPPGRIELAQRSRSYWQQRAERVGPETGAYVAEVFDSDAVVYQLRTVQAIVTQLEPFPRVRAEAACRRARHFGNHKFGGLKRILRDGLDLLPLPGDAPVASAPLSHPRFARSAQELLWPLLKEHVDELN
jgi:hypothetical protein